MCGRSSKLNEHDFVTALLADQDAYQKQFNRREGDGQPMEVLLLSKPAKNQLRKRNGFRCCARGFFVSSNKDTKASEEGLWRLVTFKIICRIPKGKQLPVSLCSANGYSACEYQDMYSYAASLKNLRVLLVSDIITYISEAGFHLDENTKRVQGTVTI